MISTVFGKAAEIIANPVRKLQMPFETNPWGICNDCKIPLGNCQGFVSNDICANFLQKKPLKKGICHVNSLEENR